MDMLRSMVQKSIGVDFFVVELRWTQRTGEEGRRRCVCRHGHEGRNLVFVDNVAMASSEMGVKVALKVESCRLKAGGAQPVL